MRTFGDAALPSRLGCDEPLFEQIELCATIHLPFHQL
jgi:hypothetical protein